MLDLSDFLDAEIAVVDPAGTIAHCNRKWQETARLGMLSPKQPGWNYIAECAAATERGCGDAAPVLAGLRSVLSGDVPSFVATYGCPFNGLHHWFQVLISAFEFIGNRHAILMHVDVSALQRDPLTGLPNRAMFDAQLDLALSLARDSVRRTGIVIIDMNKLKLINDVHGHRTGDEALKGACSRAQEDGRTGLRGARIGGDEFGIVLPVSYDSLSARRMRAYLQAGIACSFAVARHPIAISASVGMALYPDDGTTASELLTSADKSMYAQKRGLSVA